MEFSFVFLNAEGGLWLKRSFLEVSRTKHTAKEVESPPFCRHVSVGRETDIEVPTEIQFRMV